MNSMSMPTTRIFYLDALKAFAMLLVVMGHIDYLWSNHGVATIYLPILLVFHMPLFMALSGYVTNVEKFKLAKRAKLLIPFFVFGFVFMAINHVTFLELIRPEAKFGWFLYVLFAFCFFLALIRASKQNLYGGMVVVEIVLMGLYFCLHRTTLGTTLSTDHMFQLWPFFCLGIILKRGLFSYILKNKLQISLIGVSMILIICGAKCILGLTGTLDIYSNDLMSLFIVPLFFLLFHELQRWMKDRNSKVKSFVKRSVQLIGVNTLQIYVLQYFSFRLFDYLSNNTLSQFTLDNEWLMSPVIALVHCYLCVFATIVINKLKLGFVFGR